MSPLSQYKGVVNMLASEHSEEAAPMQAPSYPYHRFRVPRRSTAPPPPPPPLSYRSLLSSRPAR